MATGTVTFQSATLATPLAGLSVMADAVNDSDHGAGTAQYVKIMDGATGGTAKASVTTANGLAVDVTRVQGTVQALGSIQGVGTFQVLGTVQAHGTNQALGTFQPLAGSVHLASGTVTVLGTIQTHGTSQVLGSVQTVGTSQALGTFQPLAGSVHLAAGSVNAQGVIAHGAAIAGNPVLFGAFGSSGTQAAVADGQLTRLWSDLNGRIQVRGTIDSIGTVQVLGSIQTVGTSQVLGSVQTVGTSQVLGSVQTVGTSQVLGTTQPLAGSVHLAAGSVNAQGVIAHGAAIAGNPQLWGAFGSSGTQAAVGDGQLTRLWADLNGRLQMNAAQIGGQSPQLDTTNRVGVSLYAKNSAAGDTVLTTGASGVLKVEVARNTDGLAATFSAVADSSADGAGLVSVDRSFTYNGASWDRLRGNHALTLLSSAARTTTTNSSDQTNYNNRGLIVIVDVTSAGTGSISPSIQVKDSISSNYKTIWTASVALTANGTYAYVIYPGSADAITWTEVIQAIIGRTWRLAMVHNNANSITYSASAQMVM